MSDANPPSPSVLPQGFFGRHFASLKVLLIGFLALLFLIPVFMIGEVVYEREYRRDGVAREIARTWGEAQRIAGPVIVLPFRQALPPPKDASDNAPRYQRFNAYFLPDSLTSTVTLDSKVLYRSLYEFPVYTAAIEMTARFRPLGFDALDVSEAEPLWHEAFLSMAVSDMRGTRPDLRVAWDDLVLEMEPGNRTNAQGSGMHARLPASGNWDAPVTISLAFTLNGSESVLITPFGESSSTRISGDWGKPSFTGTYLPQERTVTDSGFEASWEISHFARGYPQAWTARQGADGLQGDLSAYGVRLLPAVDIYQKSERSVKYAILFIAFAFALFFLFEIVMGARIHPIQYCLVGASLCVFYLLLVSFAEIVAFDLAYLIAATASVLLITLYAIKVLRSLRRGVWIGFGLAAGYAYLFGVLQLEDYALVMGSVGLFILIAVLMYATRNVDWYRLQPR